MRRFILLSMLVILAALVLILPVSISGDTDVSVLRGCLGGACLVLPQAIWLLVADGVASKAVGRAPSNLIRTLVVFFVFAFALTFGVMIASPLSGNEQVMLPLGNILFPVGFVALFTTIIMVSHRVIDAEDNSKIARGTRIFILCLGFFYVLIGMFFIAPRLERLMVKVRA